MMSPKDLPFLICEKKSAFQQIRKNGFSRKNMKINVLKKIMRFSSHLESKTNVRLMLY